jgi:flagellar assembly protein FliH
MSSVIKRDDVEASKLAPLNLNDIEAEARRVMAAARQEAAAIAAQAKRDADVLRRQAHEQGHREGHEKGLIDGRQAGRDEALREASERFAQKQAALTDAMRATIEQFDEQKRELLLAARSDVLELALVIARRVVKCIVDDPVRAAEATAANAAELIEHVGARHDPVLRVHPEVLESAERAAQTMEGARHVRVVADETIAPGGCVLATTRGQLDATIDTQLDRITSLLLGEPPPRPDERKSDA